MLNQYKNNLWYERLINKINELGGIYNAHLHLDRAGTLHESYLEHINHNILNNSHISLHQKHSMITDIHSGKAYVKDDFHNRVNFYLDQMVAVNTRYADTLVDVTADGLGMDALNMMKSIQQSRNDIKLNIAAYSPFGFTDQEPERWDLMVDGARQSDFIAALPEADDQNEYPSHIGFEEHCKRTLELAQELNKPLHVHVDQRNEPSESGTEQLVQAMKKYGYPKSQSGEPMVWAIHLISPSTYDDIRFYKLLDDMVEVNLGLVTCPSAAIGMRMYRPILTPTYNSIPRILEMLTRGIHIRMGSDNIADICSPSTTANLIDEVFVLSASIRFYQPEILAKLAAGVRIDADDIAFIRDHLHKNDAQIASFMATNR